MNKRGQFFILSAVIIASIVVGLATVRNSVDVGAAPAKFYYYSQQLNEETGAVVDYALYSGEDGKIEEFLQYALSDTLAKNPGMDAFSCWTSGGQISKLFCQNNGTNTINVTIDNSESGPVEFYGNKDPKVIEHNSCSRGKCPQKLQTTGSLTISNTKEIIVSDGENTYNIPIQNSSIQSGQFYFILKTNSSSGTYVSGSL